MHNSSMVNMTKFAEEYIFPNIKNGHIKVLDVGSQTVGNQSNSYRRIFSDYDSSIDYVGCDITAGRNVDIVLPSPYDWSNIPSCSFDFIISGQMLEHVEFPWLTFIEIHRALKLGGICCVIAPSAGPMHNYPLDCYRYYPDGISALAEYAHLSVLEVFSQWDENKYPHMDKAWKDTVLIAQKSYRGFADSIKIKVKRELIHMISKGSINKKIQKTKNPAYGAKRTED